MRNKIHRIHQMLLVTIIILLANTNRVFAQTLNYTVVHKNENVGKIHIVRTQKENTVTYNFESNVNIHMIFSIKVYDKMDVVFKDNILQKAFLYRTLNGRTRVKNAIQWNGTYYSMVNKDNEKSEFKHIINYTSACLYFMEPSAPTKVFSENFQRFVSVKNIGTRKHQLDLPSGNKSVYSYNADGICSLAEIETDWANLKFVLNK